MRRGIETVVPVLFLAVSLAAIVLYYGFTTFLSNEVMGKGSEDIQQTVSRERIVFVSGYGEYNAVTGRSNICVTLRVLEGEINASDILFSLEKDSVAVGIFRPTSSSCGFVISSSPCTFCGSGNFPPGDYTVTISCSECKEESGFFTIR